jgi:hypothetical protein
MSTSMRAPTRLGHEVGPTAGGTVTGDEWPGERHSAALRHLSNRFLGQLHHCLATGKSHAEDAAWT